LFRIVFIAALFIARFSDGFAYPDYRIFTENGKQGLKNEHGQIIIPPHFDALGWSFSSDEVKNSRIGFLKNNKWGIVGIDNKILYPAALDAVYDATPAIIVAGKKQVNGKIKKGIIDYGGKVLIPYKYSVLKASDNAIMALEDDFYGLLDFQGKIILSFNYQQMKQVSPLRWFAINEAGKGALFDNNGMQLTEFILDDVDRYKNGAATATIDHMKGLLGKDGEWLLEPVFKSIDVKDGVASGNPYTAYSFYSSPSDEQWHLDSLKVYESNIYQHYASGSTWLSNADGEVIFPRSSSIKRFNNLLVVVKGGATGLYDLEKNTWIAEPAFNSLKVVGEQLFFAKEMGGSINHWGLYTTATGNKIIGGIQKIEITEQGIYLKKNNAWGFIENTGKEILPIVFDDIKEFKYDRFAVTFHGTDGIIGIDEEWHVMPGKGKILDFNPSVYIAFYDGLYNMHNYSGDRLYFTPEKLVISNDHVEECVKDSVVRRLNFEGLSLKAAYIEEDYNEVLPLSEGLIGILKSGQYGFIDPQGRLRIANRYEDIQPFKNGLASVKLQGKWGVIDKQERLVVQPLYDSIGFFSEGHAVVAKSRNFGMINTSGDLVLDIAYDQLISFAGDNYILSRQSKKGIADRSGKVLVWPKYDAIEFSNGYFIVKKDDLYGLHSLTGIAVVPPIYEMIIPVPGQDDFIIGEQKEKVVVTFD
jgi:hypothetical protein